MNNKSYEHILNPDNFQIDEREVLDFIILIKEYSKRVYFYNKKNKIDGTWYDLLKSDETFLIAEISKFDISSFSVKRVNLIKKYDQAFSLSEKKYIFNAFYNTALSLFKRINGWYLEALKNNLTQESSLIEVELETAIQDKFSPLLNDFISTTKEFFENNLVDQDVINKFKEFHSIWKLEVLAFDDTSEAIDFDEEKINYAFKKITLIFNPTYEIIYNLVIKSKNLFHKSLYGNDNHKAHVGLLFTFLELLKHSQEDLNKLTKKHLDLYFKQILKLKHLPASPNKLFVSFEIDENIDSLNVNEGSILKAGQHNNGDDILFELEEEIQLNNIALSHISTFFLSENKIFDHHSRFNLISGLYSKTHASTTEEVQFFNNDKTYFSTLGEEQVLLSQEEMNMDKSQIGFMIISPVLMLSKSDRTIDIDFKFTIDSIKYLSDLIIDIAQNKNSSEEVIFHEIFSQAFHIEYTSEEAWTPVPNYQVISPLDWSTGVVRVSFKLDKTFPAIVPFSASVHELEIKSDLPILKFKLNQDSFYNPYSFLNSMQIFRIDLNVKVDKLKSFNCYVNNEEVDIKSEFEIFGATPKKGSNLIIATDELFNKNISELSIEWDYTNLNVLNESLEDYYKEYELDIKNNSFKAQISALSGFRFSKAIIPKLVFDLFEDSEDSGVNTHINLSNIDVQALNIKPNYKLKLSDLDEFSNDLETGYLKIELVAPKFAFGMDIYDKVFNKITQKSLAIKPKKGEIESLKFPNEPFSPTISDLTLSYQAQSSIIFNQSSFSENDFNQENSFYLISPFGLENTFSKDHVSKNTLVDSFNYEGELILGFDTTKSPFQLNLLFEILKSENQNYEFSRKIDWYYSSADGWKLFNNSDILFDQTMNLMKTGVLSLKSPSDISDTINVFNQKKLFIKACSKNKSNQFSLIRSIRTNSISASEILNDSYRTESKGLPPFSVEGFRDPIEGIINTEQFIGSFKGKNKESDMDFYIRSSELLRHKNRPITKWDFEKFILAKFNWLSNVKCYSVNNENNQLNIKLLCIKKIEEHQNIDNIKLSAAEKNEVTEYLKNFSSPFSKIEIINPVFEDLWIKCKVSFLNISNGKGIHKLQTDFFNFVCSWLYNPSEQNKMGVKIKKLDIINFLNNRPYVSFITGISIIHIKKLEDGTQLAYDSAQNNVNNDYIETGVAWSLLVPKYNHKIDILEVNEYHAPEPINFNDLGIEQSFLINPDTNSYIETPSTSINSPKTIESKFNFKLKF